MKLNILILIVGLALGFFIAKRTIKPEIQIKEVVKTKIDTRTIKVTKPSGEIIETTSSVASSESTLDKTTALKQYGIGIMSDKSLYGEARLGSMPLFLIGTASMDQWRVGIKYEF